MIDRLLPPVRRGVPGDYGEIAEAFALCYLAQFSSLLSVATVRQNESYTRAWGFDQLKLFPRGLDPSNGHPGYVMALYTSGDITKVIVAIEGVREASDLVVTCAQAFNANQPGTLPGRVCTAYDVKSTTIMNAILADADFIAATNGRPHTITLTGFSLGAAIAEVMAAKMQQADPTRIISVKKFASPRVGNRAWVNGYDQRIEKVSFFAGLDPIHSYPQTMFSRGIGPLVTGAIYTFIVPDAIGYAWNGDGTDGLGSPNILGTIDCNRAIGMLRLPFDTNNIWWWHKMATYRWLLQTRLYNRGRNLNYYRFAYLEHTTENTWQSLWAPGQYWDPTMLVLGSPPADAIVPPAFDQRIQQLEAAETEFEVSGGGGWEEPDFVVSGGSWGYSTPSQQRRGRVRR